MLQTVRKIQCRETETLQIHNERISLPRADHADRIAKLTAEENRLVKAFRGTTLNLKTFLELSAKYPPGAEFPSYYSHRYLREQAQGKDDLRQMDESNRKNLAAYVKNIEIMEQLTRVQTNRALLEKHQARALAVGRKPLDVEMVGFRVGDFVLVTSPGELTVEIGLTIKKQSPIKPTFVAGYTNGYIYYTPTARQLRNPGAAQEDSDCQVAPEWEALFYKRVAGMLKKLQ